MMQRRKHLAHHAVRCTAGRKPCGKKRESSTAWTREALHRRSAMFAAYLPSLRRRSSGRGTITTASERRSSHRSCGAPDSRFQNHTQAAVSMTSRGGAFCHSTRRYLYTHAAGRYESETQGESRRYGVRSTSADWRLIRSSASSEVPNDTSTPPSTLKTGSPLEGHTRTTHRHQQKTFSRSSYVSLLSKSVKYRQTTAQSSPTCSMMR